MPIHSMRDLAVALRGRRQDLGLTQADLARRAHVSRKWIVDIEAGKLTAQFGLVLRVLDELALRLQLAPSDGVGPSAGTGSVDLDALLDTYRDR